MPWNGGMCWSDRERQKRVPRNGPVRDRRTGKVKRKK